MARDWIKMHTGMLGHVGVMRLSDRAFRLWVTLLLMAGVADDDGLVGTFDDVLYMTRWKRADLHAALAELNGRAARDGDMISVRDWDEWQPRIDRTNAERQARYRARKAADAEEGNAEGNGRYVTEGDNGPTRARRTNHKEQETEPAKAGAWAPVVEWCREVFGDGATVTQTGRARAWVGRLCATLGPPSGNDGASATGLLDQFRAAAQVDGGWKFVTANNVGERVAKWLHDRHPPKVAY